MRRLIATSLALSALLVAGCGGGDDSGSALDSSLSFLPKDAPFAVAIDTDLDGDQYKAVQALLKKFPFGGQVQDSLLQQLEQGTNVDFNDDVKPVLGNPLVVGGTGAALITRRLRRPGVVAAIQAKDKGALDDLIDKTKPNKTGEESGATIYEEDDTVFAVKDDTVIFAGDRQQLTQALKRAEGDDHLDEDTFNEGLDGLPEQRPCAGLRRPRGSAEERSGHGRRAQDQVGRRTAHARRDGGGEGRRHRRGLPPAHGGRPQRRRTSRSPPATRRPT